MHLALLAGTMVPLCVVILLGVLAGRTGAMKAEHSEVLSSFAITFCLPALLFDATARTDIQRLADWRFFLGISLGLAIVFGIGLAVALLVTRAPLAPATLQAASGSAPDPGAIGLPVLIAVAGKASVLAIVVGDIVMSLVLLAAGRPPGKDRSMLPVRRAVLSAARSSLVWAPIAGLAVAVLHVPCPGSSINRSRSSATR